MRCVKALNTTLDRRSASSGLASAPAFSTRARNSSFVISLLLENRTAWPEAVSKSFVFDPKVRAGYTVWEIIPIAVVASVRFLDVTGMENQARPCLQEVRE
jgi:hypothetical protein